MAKFAPFTRFVLTSTQRLCSYRSRPAVVALLTIADAVGKLAIFYTIIAYFADSPNRQKSKEFQAWQVINTAHSGDGGRKLAIRDLLDDGVDLSGIDLSGANLDRADFHNAVIQSANFSNTSLRDTNFRNTVLTYIDFKGANINKTQYEGATLSEVAFAERDLNEEGMSGSFHRPVREGDLLKPDFTGARIMGVQWTNTAILGGSFRNINMYSGVFRNLFFWGPVSFAHAHIRASVFKGVKFIPAQLNERGMDLAVVRVSPMGQPDFTDAELDVKFDDHPIREDDLTGAILCRTRVTDKIVNRDCPNK